MNNLFIKTKDEETANKLISLGYDFLNKEGSVWVFLNSTELSFDNKKLNAFYSDKLHFN